MATKSLIGKVVGACQVLSEIGQGGMGVIYRVKQLSLDREVALKVLSDSLAHDPKFVERFQREVRAIARVVHANILAVYDAGQDKEFDVHYMIMELIDDGRSLTDVIQERGVLPPAEAADLVRQAALGLACAHRAGIIHRDVKPDNIMVTGQNIVKVSDFGLAKEMAGADITATDSLMGTPAYMSPEQCDGKTLDGRTDIYSLGGTFFRLMTGRLPFEAETAMSMMYRHKHEPLTPPNQFIPTIPRPLSDIVVKMMGKRREDRYQTMDEVVQAIDAAMKAPAGSDTQRTVVFAETAGAQAAGVPAAVVEALPPINAKRREIDRLLAQGDARHRRGDLTGATRLWQQALQIEADPRVQERIDKHVRPQAEQSRKEGELAVSQGKFSEAVQMLRRALELDPGDEQLSKRIAEIEDRLARQREALNQIRQLLASDRHEEAVAAWEKVPAEFRDENVESQIRNVRDVVLPVRRLCDQAQEALEHGDLEKALKLYGGASSVEPQNERARHGAREIERRLERIERWLKDGYQHNIKHDYQKAIDAWSKIFGEAPRYQQATKLIAEARMRIGHEHRSREGGLPMAIREWKEILKLDPDHREAQALLEHDTATLTSLTALNDEAQTMYRLKRYTRAISCWQRMLDMDPTNRKHAVAIQQARKLLRKRRMIRAVVAAGALVCVAVAGQLAREYFVLRRAAVLVEGGSPKAAALVIAGFDGPTVFLGRALRGRLADYNYRYLLAAAGKAAKQEDFDKAEECYGLALEYASGEDKETVGRQRLGNRIGGEMAAGRRAEVDAARRYQSANGVTGLLRAQDAIRADLARALEHYQAAAEYADSLKSSRGEKGRAEGAAGAIEAAGEALTAEVGERIADATSAWIQAQGRNPESEIVKAALKKLRR